MSTNPRTRILFSNAEKVLIGLIFISIVIFYVATGDKELKSGNAYITVLTLEIALASYYLYILRSVYSLFPVGFILLNTGYLLPYSYHPIEESLLLLGKLTYALLGLFLAYKTIKESMRNKDLELFGTLLSVALLFPLFHQFYFPGNEDYLMVYHFALAFMLGTIIYNENLWDKYNAAEKKILTYVLVSTVAEVLFISIKLI